ncbi:MarR family transcriptional regulator [Metarhizobium album]|uniref:MarR family transcriptional regulator n=2 Tax=Metarhizobium album TaxID=2182425 RepID=A0A2U2DJH7_9HYPH|nr:MarR family transcriptional regulator [Rhizobium album]
MNAYAKWAEILITGHQAGPTQEDASALAEKLRHTLGKFVRAIRLQAETPTTSQSETLALLESNGPLSVAELASFRNVRHQSMRLVVTQLEGNGLVGRLPNPADGRSQLLSITAKGQDQLSQSRGIRTSKIAALIEERLSDQERQTLQAAIAILDRLS